MALTVGSRLGHGRRDHPLEPVVQVFRGRPDAPGAKAPPGRHERRSDGPDDPRAWPHPAGDPAVLAHHASYHAVQALGGVTRGPAGDLRGDGAIAA